MTKKSVIVSPVLPRSIAKEFNERISRQVRTKIVADSPDFIPVYMTKGAACADLKANLPEKGEIELCPGQTEKIDCGFCMQMPAGYEAQIRARSGLSSRSIVAQNASVLTEKGCIHPNAAEEPGGTIDEDFFYKVMVLLTNVGKSPVVVKHGDRIAQMAVKPVWYFDFVSVSDFDIDPDCDRTGGFGSTG